MTQIAMMSESEFEDRFTISGPRAVAFTLAEYVREAVTFSVNFDGEMFLTRLLDVSADSQQLVFDYSGAESLNRRLLDTPHALFVGEPHGIHVQFAVGTARETRFAGDRAFVCALPKSILRLQRRESFRIETPRSKPLPFFGRLADGSLLGDLPVHDISVAGIGLTAAQLPSGLAVDSTLPRCHFHLPEDAHELYCSARVRHITEQEGRAGLRSWRIGLQLDELPVPEQNRIQRYIAHVEHERHELGL